MQMPVESSIVKQELLFKFPSSGEEILHCLGTPEKGEEKGMSEKLSPKDKAFQTGFLITREGDAGRWEFDAACSGEGGLPLGVNELSRLCL